jgi:hypothetical protein
VVKNFVERVRAGSARSSLRCRRPASSQISSSNQGAVMTVGPPSNLKPLNLIGVPRVLPVRQRFSKRVTSWPLAASRAAALSPPKPLPINTDFLSHMLLLFPSG